MFKRTFVLSGALCLSLIPGLLHAATVSITPTPTTVGIGDIFNLSVLAKSFASPMDAGGFSIAWDPAILELGASGYTRAAGFIAPSGNGTASPGIIEDIFVFADPAKTGDFDLGILQFHAIASGTSAVTVTESLLNPFAGGGGALAVSFDSASVTVSGPGPGPGPDPGPGTEAPEPGTCLLFASGLMMTWLSRRSLQSRRQTLLQRFAPRS